MPKYTNRRKIKYVGSAGVHLYTYRCTAGIVYSAFCLAKGQFVSLKKEQVRLFGHLTSYKLQ